VSEQAGRCCGTCNFYVCYEHEPGDGKCYAPTGEAYAPAVGFRGIMRKGDAPACKRWVMTRDRATLLRLLAACPAVVVAGMAGYVDVRMPVETWARVREAGE
jgi:hypothetical protein